MMEKTRKSMVGYDDNGIPRWLIHHMRFYSVLEASRDRIHRRLIRMLKVVKAKDDRIFDLRVESVSKVIRNALKRGSVQPGPPGMTCTIHGTEKTTLICLHCLGTLHNKIEGLTHELQGMVRERSHWKANHDHLVKINAALRGDHTTEDLQAALNDFLTGKRFREMQDEIHTLRHLLWKLQPPSVQPGPST